MKPTFTFHVAPISGTPHIFSFEPASRGSRRNSDLDIATAIAQFMRKCVVESIQHYNGMTRYRALKVGGFLTCTNRTNMASHTFSKIKALIDITPQFILGVSQEIAESGTPFDVMNNRWVFTAEPKDIRAGGAQNICMPKWGTCKATWQNQNDSIGPINCGAFALTWVIAANKYEHKGSGLNRAKADARALQTKMGWGAKVTAKQLGLWVELPEGKEYRLTIILPGASKHQDYTFTGEDFVYNTKKCLYVVLDSLQHHYGGCKSPQELMRKYHNSESWRWCHNCIVKYCDNHDCDEVHVAKRQKKQTLCKCGILGPHQSCPYFTCRRCIVSVKKDGTHRCPFNIKTRDPDQSIYVGQNGIEPDGSHKALIVYDIETRFESKSTTMRNYEDFDVNETGQYIEATIETTYMDTHIPFLLVCTNAWTNDEPMRFWGDDCIEQFLEYLLIYNKNNNICIAHNGSGYDSRFIFQGASKMIHKASISPILRGTKFMKLKVGKTEFNDSMLHCPGSLKKLLKAFAPADLQKGYFPYKFARLENFEYIGPIPSIEMFGVQKTKKDFEALKKWHSEWTGPWHFNTEANKYCTMDVLGLACMVREVHNILYESTGLSPWLKTTAPSFVHEVVGAEITKNMEIPDDEENVEYWPRHNQALEDEWVTLKPFEYYFARKCLSGGRTDVKQMSCELSEQDIRDGKRVVYQDATSWYPYQQMAETFPVGVPTIQFWDDKYAPCFRHGKTIDNIFCHCYGQFIPREGKVQKMSRQPTEGEIYRDPTFYGLVCVTLIPPTDLLFPVFVKFNPVTKKSESTLLPEEHVEMFCTSVELKYGLELGYQLVAIHRFDKYKEAPSKWSVPMGKFYLEKLLNSRNAPETQQEKQELIDAHKHFGTLPKLIADSWPRWEKNDAKKYVAKIMMNSMWGKHAQRPTLPKSVIIDHDTHPDDVDSFFKNFQSGVYTQCDAIPLSSTKVMYRYTQDDNLAEPNLHGTYLPIAVFVTAYARIGLTRHLHALGKRALYHDTDSIIYIYDPKKYNIPLGDALGDWTEEDISQVKCNGGIKKFISMGPKTYGIKCFDGTTCIKAKGISLGLATQNQLNFDIMDNMVQTYLRDKVELGVDVFQMQFINDFNNGMRSSNMKKHLQINSGDFKGVLGADGFFYPKGYKDDYVFVD